MREFGTIDDNAEALAAATLFFVDSEFDGKTCRLPIANYLAFLSLRGEEIQQEIQRLRSALSQPSKAHLERDTATLLRARNWRGHNIACVAIACMGASPELLSELWSCIRQGSWTSPQLCATAAFIDPGFADHALLCIADRSSYYKSIVSLAALLEAVAPNANPLPESAKANIVEAKGIDRDNADKIAVAWLRNLHEAFDGQVQNDAM
jgi:hypothetical protein